MTDNFDNKRRSHRDRPSTREDYRAQGDRPKRRRIWLWVLGILVILLCIGGWIAFKAYSDVRETSEQMYQAADYKSKRNGQVDLSQGNQAFSVLLMGIDTDSLGRTEQGRSDTMMVMTVNPKAKQTSLLSIPRDTYTTILPNGNKDKINHAYAYGGPAGAVETVQNLLDIPIDYYVSVNMQGLEDMINVLGGVTVTPPISFNEDGHQFVQGQATTLNGEAALAYVRNRYDDPEGDYGRQARQRQVILACLKEAASLSSLPNYQEILNTIGSNVQTNMAFSDMKDLFTNYRGAANNINQAQLKGSGQMIGGVYYEMIPEENINQASQTLKQELNL
ncbi:LCP family protein [Aerococcus mictus]|uniref:LCP family glycopolymer transferase n=1 Tax=Aerococcus mictus TaxID=2976810 RepID=UPI001C0F13E1|nr:LCP family protein [Aerococcus urinae]MBU5610385.1 LCP family protein [Aerococcus urinae]MDK8388957.1 LCP family protein [Aerococcus urinae]